MTLNTSTLILQVLIPHLSTLDISLYNTVLSKVNVPRKLTQKCEVQMVIAILILLALVFIRDQVWGKANGYEWSTTSTVSFWSFIFIAVIYATTYSSSVSSNSDLIAFATNDRSAYESTVRLTKEMAVSDSSSRKTGLVVDASAMNQAKTTSEKISEYRDQVVRYNTTLRNKRAYASNFFLKHWIAKPPADLDYITFEIK